MAVGTMIRNECGNARCRFCCRCRCRCRCRDDGNDNGTAEDEEEDMSIFCRMSGTNGMFVQTGESVSFVVTLSLLGCC